MRKSVLHECQKLYTFDQAGGEFLMQDRHGRDLAESVMLSPAFQTPWVMENLHDKSTLFQTQTFLHLISRHRLGEGLEGDHGDDPEHSLSTVKMSGSGTKQLVMLNLNHVKICVA